MKIDIENSRLEKTVYTVEQLKIQNLPQIVLMGRSNVGKSSLINSLLGKKNFARVSKTPGKTRSINFYIIDEKFYLVDLPGFGYVSKGKRETLRFSNLVQNYFQSNNNIVLVCHLIDSRIGPTPLDNFAKKFIERLNLSYCILLTKVDKLKINERIRLRNFLYSINPELKDKIIFYSSKTNEGKKEFQKFILDFLFIR